MSKLINVELIDTEVNSKLLSKLEQLINVPFAYLPNPGNAGDAAIFFSTLQVFKALKLDFELIHEVDETCRAKVIVIGGGGAIANEDSNLAKNLSKAIDLAQHVIVLPHTIKAIDKTLSNKGAPLTIYCREQVTYDYLLKFDHIDKHLVHDIVFNLPTSVLSKPIGFVNLMGVLKAFSFNRFSRKANVRLQDVVKCLNYKRVMRGPVGVAKHSRVLNAFRLDEEKTDIKIPKVNFDISAMYQVDVAEPALAMFATSMMLSTINLFDEVKTNRLHVAILGAMLGKKIYFYDNAYFKCKAVYLHSMREKYPNVTFAQQS